jgi:flagellar export protein FliJ
MTTERTRRLNRLLELRKAELDRSVGDLAKTRDAERMAVLGCEQARESTVLALAARDEKAKRGVSVDDWTEVERWLAHVKGREDLAQRRLVEARRAVFDATTRVQEARKEQGKIERLLSRILESDRQESLRADQKMNDESAAARFLRQRERQ